MINKYIRIVFNNAKLFPKNENTKDIVTNLEVLKNGKLKHSYHKRAFETLTSFKEPITVHQVSNMLHTLVGERPVPSFRETFYKPDEYIFNLALNSFLRIDTPKVKQYLNGVEVETFILENTKINKASWNSWSKPNKLNWFIIEKYMDEYYQEFIEKMSSILRYNVKEKRFEDFFSIAIGDNDFDDLLNWLVTINKTPIINFLTKEKFDRSEITKNKRITHTVTSGVDLVHFLDGEILVPYDEFFVQKIIKPATNILDGGLCKIVGIYYADELENTNNFTLVSEISDEKY